MENNRAFAGIIVSICLLISSFCAYADSKRYVVYFTNKQGGNPYSLSNPSAFLSAKSILRRTQQNLQTDSTDLPVTPAYLQGVAAAGAQVLYPLRWLNAAIVDCPSNLIGAINSLPYVLNSKPLTSKIKDSEVRKRPKSGTQNIDYGASEGQNSMLGIDSMHAWGFHGEGITIAVMDAGFYNVSGHAAFAPLFENEQILGVKDFVSRDGEVYQDHWHGGAVLSNICGYLPGKIVGGAYKSNVYLLRTEDAATENEIECAYWVAGLEFADSAGVDIINSSLGYSTFDNSALDYSYNTLNGSTSLASKAAGMAAAKGMVVVCSAGNEGNNSGWGGYITVPSDAPNILTVGSVTAAQSYSSFSGHGPTADGRIKPDVVAQGSASVIADVFTNSETSVNSGTSFSAPITAGLVAGFWQAHPELSAMQIINMIKSSGTQATAPNNETGSGIPNFVRAHLLAGAKPTLSFPLNLNVYPNPSDSRQLQIELVESSTVGWADLLITDATGKLMADQRIYFDLAHQVQTVSTTGLAAGMYTVYLTMGGKRFINKIILQ